MVGSTRTKFRRQLLAWWLSLLLGRVLAPEAAVLHLHAHAHTLAEPAQVALASQPGKALVTARHQHCHEEQLYQVPFLPAIPVALPAFRQPLAYAAHRRWQAGQRLAHSLARAVPRGPPILG